MMDSGIRVRNALWIIADTHFGHRNIVSYQQRPESHEVIMLSEWIKRVGEHDQILHLGDCFLGPRGAQARWAAIISRLPGEKFLILGNHDKAPHHLYEQAGFTILDPFVWKGIAFTHRPISKQWPLLEGSEEWHTNVHGHVHGNAYNLEHDGTYFDDRRYINACVEMTNLAPRQLGSFL